MARLSCGLLLCALLLQPAFPETLPTESLSIQAVRINEPITIDGILTEHAWQHPAFTGILQQEPAQGEPPTFGSDIWLGFDDDALYFAALFHDASPDSIMARLVRRDFIWGDPSDGCVLYLDTYHDHRNGLFFYVSAAGAVADGVIENDTKQPNDLTWDAVWSGAAHIGPEGWSVEMKVPFSQLRFKEAGTKVWGVNVERYISRKNETDMIAYTPRDDNRFVSRFPNLVGIEGVAPSRHLEVLPYITARAERLGNDRQDPFKRWERYLPGAGLDVKAGLSSSLTFDGTINPDFCQVEVDPANVNLTDVETLYEEKRPFFTEGVGIFRFGRGGLHNNVSFNWSEPNVFYSRRIGRTPQRYVPGSDPAAGYYADVPSVTRILGAGKISGELGAGWKIGSILALTRREEAEVEQNRARSAVETEPLTYYGVFRAQRDFNEGMQGAGILSTYTGRSYQDEILRDYTNKGAAVVAADGFTFLDRDKTYVLSGWTAFSSVSGTRGRMIALQRSSGHYFQRPDAGYLGVDSAATSMQGVAGRFILDKNRGAWVFNTGVGFISPRFELNDLGSCAFSDLLNMHVLTAYRWNTPTAYYQAMAVNAAAFAGYDFGGNKTAEGYYLGGVLVLPIYYGANLSATYCPRSLNARLTRGGPLMLNPVNRQLNLSAFTDNRQWWVLNAGATLRTGDAGNSSTLFASAEVKVSTTLTLSVGPALIHEINEAQYLSSFADAGATETFGRRYLFARLDRHTLATDIRADWIISPRLSFQVYVQPYVTAGKYTDFKVLDRPKSFSFSPCPGVESPDFTYISLQGNAVLRWEYLPGSTMYLVWTQSRLDDAAGGDFHFDRSMDRMFQIRPDNILMLKLSYWLGV